MTSSALGKLKFKTQDEKRYGKIIHSGFLNKRSKGKSWTKRYAVLWEDLGLRFYENESRGNVVGKIKMKYINEIRKDHELDANHLYLLSNSLKKTWEFGCDDESQLSEWIHILQSTLTLTNNDNDDGGGDDDVDVDNDTNTKHVNYIGHHGHNLSNLEDFSKDISSRMSSIQSLSALAILSGAFDEEEEEEDEGGEEDNYAINGVNAIREEDEYVMDDDEDMLEIEIQKIDSNLIKQIEERLTAENTNIVFEGHLERKTNQKVLGKHLWETRYFKLSTHSLSIYTNDKINIAESVIKLSSIISVNRNTRNVDGNDLKNNRFDINTKHKTLHLRTENQMLCQQWVHFLSCERKKHRKSIRTNLKSLEKLKKRHGGNKNKATNSAKENNVKSTPKSPIRRYKRQKTSRDIGVVDEDYHDMDEIDINANDADVVGDGDDDDDNNNNDEENNNNEDEFDENYVAPTIPNAARSTSGTRKNRVHSRNLSMKSWATDIEQRHHKNSIAKMNMNKTRSSLSVSVSVSASITKSESFEGFLIRKIGHNSDKIGEKIYFRLSDDTLEFSKIDEMIPMTTASNEKNINSKLNKLHSSNILGTISVEHIKTVEMIANENDDEFIITFNQNNCSTDWILKTEKSDKGNAIKWVNILRRAQKEARHITKTINNEDDEQDDDDNKKKKKLVGSIKALQKMINDETIEELEMARNHELNNTNASNLDKGFEINSLENKNTNSKHHNQSNKNPCSCLCFQ